MEKTVQIDGKSIRFKSTGATPLRYKAQFQKDYFVEIIKLNSLKKLQEGEDIKPEDVQHLDFNIIYNIAWVLAKTADERIPDPFTWLDGFSQFPLVDIIVEIQDLISSSFQTKKKSNHPAYKRKYPRKRS